MTWIKICGITNLEDALTAVNAGADAVGFVFYEKSPRYVAPQIARAIIVQLPEAIEKVGVFVNQFEDSICALADEVGLSGVQMHGDNEDPRVADLVARRRPELKIFAGVSMNHPSAEGWAMMWDCEAVYAFLLDSGCGGQPGGTGRQFDWAANEAVVKVVKNLGRVIVAGGLTPSNVAEAMGILKPWGVDVSSGVEARPGKKDPDKVRRFIAAVRNADRENPETADSSSLRSSE